MPRLLAPFILVLCVVALPAAASDSYQAAIDGCRSAIGGQLGMTQNDLSFNLKKIRSSVRHRDMEFSVSARDDASPVQSTRVSCRARTNGEVLTVAFADPSVVQTVATH